MKANAAATAVTLAPSSSASVPLAGAYSARFVRLFTWYVRRLFAKKFHTVRLARGSAAVLRELDSHEGPALVALSHSSWWDPLLALLLGSLCPSRSGCAPMDVAMLRKFAFFRRLGIFGVDPDDPRGLPGMTAYVLERFASERKGTLWITPQGKFTDVRETVVLRPGAAAIASRAGPTLRAVVIAIEYGFWVDQKPEVFVRCASVCGDFTTTTQWHRALEVAMQANAAELAALVRAREPKAFEPLLRAATGGNPFMKAWLKLRGKDAELVDRTRVQAQ